MKRGSEVNYFEVDTKQGKLMVPYEVRHSPRAKYVRLTLSDANNALIVLPRRAKLEDGLALLRKNGDWIQQKLKAAKPQQSLLEYLERNPALSASGKSLRLQFIHSGARFHLVWDLPEESARMEVLPGIDGDSHVKRLLQSMAKRVLPLRTRRLAKYVGKEINRVTVRDQRTLWGSCSGHKNISLNWRLLLLPPELADYIIFHELAHLTEMNHGKRFWDLLATYDPDALANDRRIGEIGGEIMKLGR